MKRRDFHSLALLIALPGLWLTGCGGKIQASNCTVTGIKVTPATATADHTAAAPMNSQHFTAFPIFGPAGSCIALNTAVALNNVTWSVSDPVNVTISNVQGPDYGTATCKNATAAPATITAAGTLPNGSPASATATLGCK